MSTADLLLILGESVESCCRRHVGRYLCSGTLESLWFTTLTAIVCKKVVGPLTSLELSLPCCTNLSFLSYSFSLLCFFFFISKIFPLTSAPFNLSNVQVSICCCPAVLQCVDATMPNYSLMPQTMSSSRKRKVGQADRWRLMRGKERGDVF